MSIKWKPKRIPKRFYCISINKYFSDYDRSGQNLNIKIVHKNSSRATVFKIDGQYTCISFAVVSRNFLLVKCENTAIVIVLNAIILY